METNRTDALMAAAEIEFARLYPRRNVNTITAFNEIVRIARGMAMRRPA